jgi:hypothetical protein
MPDFISKQAHYGERSRTVSVHGTRLYRIYPVFTVGGRHGPRYHESRKYAPLTFHRFPFDIRAHK